MNSRLLLCLWGLSLAGCNRTPVEQAQNIAAQRDESECPAVPLPDNRQAAEPRSLSDSDARDDEAGGADAVPAEVADTGERLLLFLPRAPLIIELHVTIDGHPLREPREELVGEMLQLADRDDDGRPTWGEVFADPKRIFGLLQTDSLNLASRKEFMKANDTNRNGLVDRDEARRFVTTVKRSEAALSVESTVDVHESGARQSIVRKLLDADGDSVLDREELIRAAQRMLSRDANDDGIVTWPELDDSLAGDELASTRQKPRHRGDHVALPLGLSANWPGIVDGIQQTYLRDDLVPTSQAWLRQLDANGDRRLSTHEVRSLDSVEPDAVVAVAFGETQKEAAVPRLTLEKLSPRLTQLDVPAREQIALVSQAEGYRIRFTIDDRVTPNDRWPSAEAQLAALDANGNGYLEQDETVGAFGSKTFGEVDANADGKIQLPELAAHWARRRPPRLSGVYAMLRMEQDLVFSLLDTNHDGRLTTRELHGGADALTVFDTDGDGRVTAEELPETLQIVLGRGQPALAPTVAASNETYAAPAWFRYMDANGDTEVSREEFPGSSDKFRSLDRDHDGFITPDEAQ